VNIAPVNTSYPLPVLVSNIACTYKSLGTVAGVNEFIGQSFAYPINHAGIATQQVHNTCDNI
jgi:hypothetical protein